VARQAQRGPLERAALSVQGGSGRLLEQFGALRRKDVADRPAVDLLPAPADPDRRVPRDVQGEPFVDQRKEGVRQAVHEARVELLGPAQGLLGQPSLTDVADQPGEADAPLLLEDAQGQLERELGAVAPQPDQLDGAADDLRLTRGEEARDAAFVHLAKALGHEHRERLIGELVGGVAEQLESGRFT
jgi:hypothetical protein